ncbi:hypothetical protein ACCQ10_18835 [Xanthomonas sp. NCPPB 1325]|uniref:hypothetical protein n=1 Tax=Xanthomonas sp. NCPPB 1325 TaxID=487529 RepID=UPI0035583DFF
MRYRLAAQNHTGRPLQAMRRASGSRQHTDPDQGREGQDLVNGGQVGAEGAQESEYEQIMPISGTGRTRLAAAQQRCRPL